VLNFAEFGRCVTLPFLDGRRNCRMICKVLVLAWQISNYPLSKQMTQEGYLKSLRLIQEGIYSVSTTIH
jgi:hypothetical protein